MNDALTQQSRTRQSMQAHKLEVIGQLAAGVAHEINTPSQYVTDNLQFLVDAFRDLLHAVEHPDAPSTQANLEFLRIEVPAAIEQSLEGMRRISEIVRGIKTFAHPGTGTRTECDVNEMLRSTAAVARNEWKYVADLQLELAPELPCVWAFADEIQHVFLNLIVNAAQAIAETHGEATERGRIRVTSRATTDGIEVRIEDDGPGVPADIRDRIFEPFFTTKPAGTGTGQGLAICHRIVEHHGGRIELDSGVGRGAAFVVSLPLGDARRAAA